MMRVSPLRVLLVLLLLVAASSTCFAGRWDAPPVSAELAQLPKLTQPLVIDGRVDEWRSAACVPMRSRSYIIILQKGHTWRGPADAGMEFYCAWNSDGLCVAAIVADDQVLNDRPGKDFWQQDCIEVFIDGRAGANFLTSPYSTGAYQLLIRPPVGGQNAEVAVNPRHGRIEGIKVSGVRTASGYAVEALVPWSAFSEFTAKQGAKLGLQFALDDYDVRDIGVDQPFQMTYGGAPDVWMKPENLTSWTLVDALQTGPKAYLGPLAALDVPPLTNTLQPVLYSVEFAGPVAARVAAVEFTATDFEGTQVLERKTPVWAMPPPWQSSAMTRLAWDTSGLLDGYYMLCITAYDHNGRPLGYACRPTLVVGNTVRQAADTLRAANIPRLAAVQPFKAEAYMGAAACTEKFKWLLSHAKAQELMRAAQELDVRFDVLKDGRLDITDPGIYELLALTAVPDAQVVVEYRDANRAGMTFNWGSVPLITATVTWMPESEAAAKAASPDIGRVKIAAGGRLIDVESGSRKAAQRAAELIAEGQPITRNDVDLVRRDLLNALPAVSASTCLPDGASVYCGDLHMHTCYSDGRCTPAGLMFEAMYAGFDYAAVTDHNRIDGAQEVQQLLLQHGFSFPCIVGEEITTRWAHFNAYPLVERIPPSSSAEELIEAAHAQGAVIQWNHPHSVRSDWMQAHINTDIRQIGLDAWEHVPREYDKRKSDGILPVVVGTSDAHYGTFHSGERTVIFAPAAGGRDVAEAIRHARAVAVVPERSQYLYGSDDMISLALSALAEGPSLKDTRAGRLRVMLGRADVPGILLLDPPKPK